MRKKNLSAFLVFIVFSYSNSFAEVEVKNYFEASNHLYGFFPDENINLSEENLKTEFVGYSFFENILSGYSKNYKVITLIDKFREPLNVVTRNISILLDGKRMSYVILKPSLIKNTTYFFKDLKDYQVITKNYFNKRVKSYKYTNLEVYEKKHNGYIERIFIAKRDVQGITSNFGYSMDYILGETFYPEELDREFTPEIIRSLNIAMYRINLETKRIKQEIKLKEYLKKVSNWAGNPNEGYKQPKRDKNNKIIEEPENDESYLKELEPSEEFLKNESQYDSLED